MLMVVGQAQAFPSSSLMLYDVYAMLQEQLSNPNYAGGPFRLLQELAYELAQLQLLLPKGPNDEPVLLAKQLTTAVGNGLVTVLKDVVLEVIAATAASRVRSVNTHF